VGTFNYYLIYFQLKYMRGDFYLNTLATSCSELLAYILSGLILTRLGLKLSYLFSFFIVICGSLLYFFLRESHEHLTPLLLIAASFGISSSLNIDWNGNAVIFPVIYASSTNGICNLFARLSNIMAPQVAEFQ
jgi:Na+/melibiose symporter-like transporter